MNIWNRLTARLGAGRDMLGFAAAATPSADEWVTAFTQHFMRHHDIEQGARALMTGLRFYTADFVTAVAALPAGETRQPAIGGNIAQATYSATRAIIVDVYEKVIRRNAGHAEILAAFTAAAPALLGRYHGAVYLSSGAYLR